MSASVLCGEFPELWRIQSLSTPTKRTVQRRLSSSAENDGAGLGVAVGAGVGDGVGDGLGEGVGEGEGVGVGIGLGVAVGEGMTCATGWLVRSRNPMTTASRR